VPIFIQTGLLPVTLTYTAMPMKKNAWFFWIDRLHITPSERYLVTGLMALYAVLWLLTPFFETRSHFDEAYYAPLMAEFSALTADRYEADKLLLDQYYPGQQDTIEVLARQRIPESFRQMVDSELERRQLETGLPIAAGAEASLTDGAGFPAGGRPSAGDLPGTDAAGNNTAATAGRSSTGGPLTTDAAVTNAAAAGGRPSAGDLPAPGPSPGSPAADTLLQVSLNHANASELTQLPGIGPVIASRIVEYRAENGPFQRRKDIMNVRGIGPARYEQIKDYLTL